MRLFRKVPKVNQAPLDKATVDLEEARKRRRTAFRKFVKVLCETPIEAGLERLGDDLTSTDREAK